MPGDCQKCGNCCREMNSPPFKPALSGQPAEEASLPTEILREYFGGMDRREADDWPDGVPCFWLTDDNECEHYEFRPQICREHKPGSRDDCPVRPKAPLFAAQGAKP